jgi:hypothetical protein
MTTKSFSSSGIYFSRKFIKFINKVIQLKAIPDKIIRF